MADHVPITPGSGLSVATDEVGGIHHQRVKIEIGTDGVAQDVLPPDADGKTAPSLLPAAGLVWNGASWDRARGNTVGTALASAARTATTIAPLITNHNARGIAVLLSVTVAGTGDLTIQLVTSFGLALGNGVATSTVMTGTGQKGLLLYPGVIDADVAPDGRSGAIGRNVEIRILHSDGSSWTYSVDYGLIV